MDLDPFKNDADDEDAPPVPQVSAGGMPAQADPSAVSSPLVSGGLGGTNDGTQVPLEPSTAVPGKPMVPLTGNNDPAGGSTDEAQAMDTPSSSPHAERGGSG